ncbi:unnamed protein product, partial [marine sediment metagenome]
PDFDGNHVVIIDGAYGGQARDISGVTTAGVVTPASNFGGVILASTTFAILPIRTTPAEVATLTALVVALIADIEGATGIFHEQEDVGFTENVAAAEIFIVTLTAADSLMRYVKGLLLGQSRQLFTMDFWSDPQEEVQVPVAAGTLVFTPTVTVEDLPVTAAIVRAVAMFKFRMVELKYILSSGSSCQLIFYPQTLFFPWLHCPATTYGPAALP